MKQASKRSKQEWPEQISKRVKEGVFILVFSLALYLFIALISYHESDPAWSHASMSQQVENAAGKTGAWIADILLSLFGYVAYFFPAALLLSATFFYREPVQGRNPFIWGIRTFGLLVAFTACCGLAVSLIHSSSSLPMSSGGLLGSATQNLMVSYLNPVGSVVMLMAMMLIGITLFSGFSWLKFFEVIGENALRALVKLKQKLPAFTQIIKLKIQPLIKRKAKVQIKLKSPLSLPPKPKPQKVLAQKAIVKPDKAPKVLVSKSSDHQIPSLALLEASTKKQQLGYTTHQLQELSQLVETRLLEFGIEVKVVGVLPGPVITRFELSLAAGIKVSKITSLAKDLARSLSVISVRVVEVIPGKSVVGLEIPNVHRELVRLKEVFEEAIYQQSASPLSLALGKDIAGRPIIVDLAKMPHLLVAGTTGSGKSVGLNAMLLSILFKASAEQVRLILIDPKMLELAVYDRIPHLLTPVVTDMKDAANALRWCVAEMERRYQLMAAIGVRNLSGYNQKVQTALNQGKPILDPLWHPKVSEKPQPLNTLPFVVVVVDEFADMIMVVGKKVEELIARIAQKARAAGIHLILATQRPSVDVITGLIKANIPTRIAFQVSSRVDSRTILDQAGAEQLLGHGDMLYLPPGVGIPHRIHGAFVSDEEVHSVTNQLRQSGKPDYIESLIQTVSPGAMAEEGEADALYDQAIAVVTQARKASISLVQRRLKIGYNRAARLIERMEAEGVVSEVHSNGLREVLAPPPVEE